MASQNWARDWLRDYIASVETTPTSAPQLVSCWASPHGSRIHYFPQCPAAAHLSAATTVELPVTAIDCGECRAQMVRDPQAHLLWWVAGLCEVSTAVGGAHPTGDHLSPRCARHAFLVRSLVASADAANPELSDSDSALVTQVRTYLRGDGHVARWSAVWRALVIAAAAWWAPTPDHEFSPVDLHGLVLPSQYLSAEDRATSRMASSRHAQRDHLVSSLMTALVDYSGDYDAAVNQLSLSDSLVSPLVESARLTFADAPDTLRLSRSDYATTAEWLTAEFLADYQALGRVAVCQLQTMLREYSPDRVRAWVTVRVPEEVHDCAMARAVSDYMHWFEVVGTGDGTWAQLPLTVWVMLCRFSDTHPDQWTPMFADAEGQQTWQAAHLLLSTDTTVLRAWDVATAIVDTSPAVVYGNDRLPVAFRP